MGSTLGCSEDTPGNAVHCVKIIHGKQQSVWEQREEDRHVENRSIPWKDLFRIRRQQGERQWDDQPPWPKCEQVGSRPAMPLTPSLFPAPSLCPVRSVGPRRRKSNNRHNSDGEHGGIGPFNTRGFDSSHLHIASKSQSGCSLPAQTSMSSTKLLIFHRFSLE